MLELSNLNNNLTIVYLTINNDKQLVPICNPNNISFIKPTSKTDDHDIKSGLFTIQKITVIMPNNGAILLKS